MCASQVFWGGPPVVGFPEAPQQCAISLVPKSHHWFLQGTLQKGAGFITIISHEEHVIYGQQHAGHLAYIMSTATERSGNLLKVTQLIRS